MTEINALRIERAIIKFYIPYKRKEIGFALSPFGPNTYQLVGQEILKKSLKVPTGDYTASLLHSAYCNSQVKDEPELNNIWDLIKLNWLWIFNQNLWTDKGVYVIQDLGAKGRKDSLNINQLEKILKKSKEIGGVRFSKDGKVRFAPKGSYKRGEQTYESLAEDGFIIASCNVDGAKKLAEVSSKFKKRNPMTFNFEIAEKNPPELRISALYEHDGGLYIGGNYWSHSSWGRAFGVL